MLDLPTLVKNRQTTRCFSNKPVDIELVKRILDLAKYAPTGGNLQPWHVAVVRGRSKQKLIKRLLVAFDKRETTTEDYSYYPIEFFPPYDLRRHYAGVAAYQAANIEFSETYVDWQSVIKLIKENYRFFGADIGLIFYLDKRLTKGAYVDMGLFMQNIMLLAEHFGLNTCPQAALNNYTKIIKQELNIGDDMDIVCAMALGYADHCAPINQCRTHKESFDNFTTFFD